MVYSHQTSKAKDICFPELLVCPNRKLLFLVAKSKALLEFENFGNEKTGPQVVFTSFMYVTESSLTLLFPHFLTCAISVGSSKANTLPYLRLLLVHTRSQWLVHHY